MNYFLNIQTYQTKNRAHEELQNCVSKWQHALVDEDTLKHLLDAIRETVNVINAKYTRCQDIVLMTQFYPRDNGSGIVWVEGNFHLSITKVLREETRDIKQKFH